MISAPNPQPANASAGLAGQITPYGFQLLPTSSLAQEQVRLVTGAIIRTVPVTSVSTIGSGFGLALSYNSQNDYHGPLGHKWRHNYEMKLDVGPSLVTYISGDGQQVDFISDGSGGWTVDTSVSAYVTYELTNTSGTIWTITDFPGENVWRFDAAALSGYPETAGRLLDITDRNGNVVTLNYTSGKLTSIDEPQSRSITLSYTGDFLTSVTDPESNTTLLTYDDYYENLLSVSGPEGCTVSFGYDTPNEHLITSITDSRGNKTQYQHLGERIESIIFPDGNILGYKYLWGEDAPLEILDRHDNGQNYKATQIIMPGGETTEYRFEPGGNLWRVILPSGNIKRYFWNDKQRFLYCSEGQPIFNDADGETYGPSDSIYNRFTRVTVDENGDTIASLDPTGILSTYSYDSDGRLLASHPAQGHFGVQGNWPEYYGSEGFLLCAFNYGGTDVYEAPSYLDSSVSTAITNGDGSGGNTYTGDNQNSEKIVDPRAPIKGPDSLVRGIGFWRQSGAAGPGASFEFDINLNSAKAFNLSLYSHSADLGLNTEYPFRYNAEFGRDVELEVEDMHGVQKVRIHNNAPGVWLTFPVEGDGSNPIKVTVTATGSNTKPAISALAFDPYLDRRTHYEYTGGLLTKVTNGLGEETDYAYNADGTLSSVTDARNKTTQFEYLDSHKNLTKITDADSNVTTMVYDDNGNVTSRTDANLNTTSMTYDGKNRLLTVTDPLSRVTTYDYDSNGNLLSIEDALNRTTSFTYNSVNQLISVEDELGQTLRITYDINGRRKSVIDHRGAETRFHYNADGNLIRTELPEGEEITYSIDALNQVVAVTGPNGNQDNLELMNLTGAGNFFKNPGAEDTHPALLEGAHKWKSSDQSFIQDFTQSSEGTASLPLSTSTDIKVFQESLPLPEGAKFAVKAMFRRSQQSLVLSALSRDNKGDDKDFSMSIPLTDDQVEEWNDLSALEFTVPGDVFKTPSNITLQEFSARIDTSDNIAGWLDDLRLHMLSEATHYDLAGRLKYSTSPTGARTKMIRDRMGRVIAIEDPSGERVEMTLDALDRVVEVKSPSGETQTFAYNEVGSLVSFTDGRSKTTTFVYDDLNRLTSIVYPDTNTEDFAYDGVGNLTSYTNITNQVKTFAYDDADRLETITYQSDSSTVSFTYDDVDNMLTQTERNGDVTTFTYDDIDRVTSVTRTPDTGNTTPAWVYHYTYDANGNRLSSGSTSGASDIWSVETPGRYDQAYYNEDRFDGGYDSMNRPGAYRSDGQSRAEFQYDHEGRRTEIQFGNGNTSRVTYDIVGRPLEFNTSSSSSSLLSVKYGYDIKSQRTSQVSGNDTFEYHIDEDGRLVGESINRMASLGQRDFQHGKIEGLSLSSSGLECLPLNDSFSGDKINCDRWRVGHRATYGVNEYDPDDYIGAEIRQSEGLNFVFPRGYTDRTYYRDQNHPVNDDFGLRFETYRYFVQHTKSLSGDFDVSVDFDFFIAGLESNYSGFELYLTPNPDDHSVSGFTSLKKNVDRYTFTGPSALNYQNISGEPIGKLRLVRSGSQVTAHRWNASTSSWTTYGAWTATVGTEPLWVGIASETRSYSTMSATARNFVFNSLGAAYNQSGTFTSPVYDAGRNVSWQNLSWSETLPAGTDIEFQLAYSDSESGPWTYVGPDGTANTKFTTSSGESVGASVISRYCRYKVFFTGDGSNTPTLGSVELSYSGGVTSQLRTYTFDAAGNVTEKVTVTDSSTVTETRSYNDLNEITQNLIDDGTSTTTWTYTHDNRGNMTSKSDGTDTYTYIWTEDNQLESVELNSSTMVDYVYDSGSRMLQRVEGSTTTTYYWDGWDLVKEEKDDGSSTEVTNYLVPHGEVLAFERDNDWFYLHGDGLSSTQLVTDKNGAQAARVVYGAWGDTLSSNDSVPGGLDVRFVGGLGVRNDSTTGLIYMRHRWYDASLQRFISRDPIRHTGGHNLYSYTANPKMLIDPFGLAGSGASANTGHIITTTIPIKLPNFRTINVSLSGVCSCPVGTKRVNSLKTDLQKARSLPGFGILELEPRETPKDESAMGRLLESQDACPSEGFLLSPLIVDYKNQFRLKVTCLCKGYNGEILEGNFIHTSPPAQHLENW